jgi:hypothetical protein
MNTGITETGYSCSCDLLPGWVVSGSDDFEQFKKEVKESIDFYVEYLIEFYSFKFDKKNRKNEKKMIKNDNDKEDEKVYENYIFIFLLISYILNNLF